MGSRLVGSDLRTCHRFWTDYEPPGNNEPVILGPSLHSFPCPTSKWVSGKPLMKCAPKTPKRGQLATSVLPGGKLKISAHILRTKFDPKNVSPLTVRTNYHLASCKTSRFGLRAKLTAPARLVVVRNPKVGTSSPPLVTTFLRPGSKED
jgi:hypothetical protein